MARPRLPTAALELRGAYKVNPGRGKERADEPIPTGPIGEPPDTISDLAAEVWRELAGVGFWLTNADRFQLEIASELMVRFRIAIDPKLIGPLITVLNKLGFSPAERSKIKAPGAKKEKSAFANFK